MADRRQEPELGSPAEAKGACVGWYACTMRLAGLMRGLEVCAGDVALHHAVRYRRCEMRWLTMDPANTVYGLSLENDHWPAGTKASCLGSRTWR